MSDAVIEDEVMRRLGPRRRPEAESNCVRWRQQPGYMVFGGQKVGVARHVFRARGHPAEVSVPSCGVGRDPVVGTKMVASDHVPISTEASLGVIAAIMATTIVASVVWPL